MSPTGPSFASVPLATRQPAGIASLLYPRQWSSDFPSNSRTLSIAEHARIDVHCQRRNNAAQANVPVITWRLRIIAQNYAPFAAVEAKGSRSCHDRRPEIRRPAPGSHRRDIADGNDQ